MALKPADTLYVTPKPAAIADATVQNAGYFVGLRAASDPEKKGDLPRPTMVVRNGSKRANLALGQNSPSGLLRQHEEISLGIDERTHLW